MRFRFFFIFAPLFALLSMHGNAQTAPHPGAKKAMERIVLERDFGDNLKFHSREVITIAENSKVPGLNGLMFMRWKGAAPAMEVVASVQWFEDTSDLLHFYRAEKARTGRGLLPIGDTVIWKTGDNSYLWTDGEHFVVGLGGSPAPPKEMLEAWLALIGSNPPDLARVPVDSP
jgi:hypothetical protein